jgi:hypothetical protein
MSYDDWNELDTIKQGIPSDILSNWIANYWNSNNQKSRNLCKYTILKAMNDPEFTK